MWRLPSVLPAPWRRTDWAASLARWPPRRCCTSPATCAALHFPFWMLSKQNLKYEHPLKPFDTSHWSVSPYKPFDLIYTLFKVPDHQLICLAWVPGPSWSQVVFPGKNNLKGSSRGWKHCQLVGSKSLGWCTDPPTFTVVLTKILPEKKSCTVRLAGINLDPTWTAGWSKTDPGDRNWTKWVGKWGWARPRPHGLKWNVHILCQPHKGTILTIAD